MPRNRVRTDSRPSAPRSGGLNLSNCTPTIYKVDMTTSAAAQGQTMSTMWDSNASAMAAWNAILTDPENIRCIEIRSTLNLGTNDKGTVGIRSDANLFATWILLHSSDFRTNRFEDIVWWSPGGVKGKVWERHSSLAAGTGGYAWTLDVRIWRVSSAMGLEGWVTNPYTSMDLDGNRI